MLSREKRDHFTSQHFHIYLMAYGVFRFAHEFLRATPRILGPISGYQLAALAVAVLGLLGFLLRRRAVGFDRCTGHPCEPKTI
jgi:phosphatidylglycerol:prolipoprotein diacylglycerol transferase